MDDRRRPVTKRESGSWGVRLYYTTLHYTIQYYTTRAARRADEIVTASTSAQMPGTTESTQSVWRASARRRVPRPRDVWQGAPLSGASFPFSVASFALIWGKSRPYLGQVSPLSGASFALIWDKFRPLTTRPSRREGRDVSRAGIVRPIFVLRIFKFGVWVKLILKRRRWIFLARRLISKRSDFGILTQIFLV